MNTTPVVGIDLGFGRTKIAAPGFRTSFPALVAEPGADAEPTGLIEWDSFEHGLPWHHRFLVGEPALERGHHRYSTTSDKINTPEEMAKYLVTLAKAATHFDTDVLDVATGLPPSDYKVQTMRQQLIDNMAGRFDFRYEGRPYEITVRNVSVDPQAGAAFFDLFLRDDGSLDLRSSDLADLRSVIVDVGHNTTDIALMNGRKAAIGSRSLLTVHKAVWSAYEEVSRLLSLEPYRVEVPAAEVDAKIRSGEQLRVAGQPVPLRRMLMDAAGPIARAIVADVRRHAGDVRLWDVALLVGGGAHVFGQVFQTELGVPVRIPQAPEFANAAGYFKRRIEQE